MVLCNSLKDHSPIPFICRSAHTHHASIRTMHLVLILLGIVVDDVEEAELVHALGGRHDAEPVTELLLLEELLGPAVIVSATLLLLSPRYTRTGT